MKTFDETFDRIASLDSDLRNIAFRSFQWLLSQDGEARDYELMAATCYDVEGDHDGVCFDVTVDTVLKACQHLIIFVEDPHPPWEEDVGNLRRPSRLTGYFRFMHLSVYEYCWEHRWRSADIHAFAAKVCLSHLLRWTPEAEEVGPRGSYAYRLSRYSHMMWVFHAQKHAQASGRDTAMIALIRKFTGFPGRLSAHFKEWHSAKWCWDQFDCVHYQNNEAKGEDSGRSRDEMLLLSAGGNDLYCPSPRVGLGEYYSLPLIACLGLDIIFSSVPLETIELPLLVLENEPEPLLGYLSPSSSTPMLQQLLNILAARRHTTPSHVFWYFLALAHRQSCSTEFEKSAERYAPLARRDMQQCLPETVFAIQSSLNVGETGKVLGTVIIITLVFMRGTSQKRFSKAAMTPFIATLKGLLERGAEVDFEPFHRPLGHIWPRPLTEAIRLGLGDAVTLILQHSPAIRDWDLREIFERLDHLEKSSRKFPVPNLPQSKARALDRICHFLIVHGEMHVSEAILTDLVRGKPGGRNGFYVVFSMEQSMANSTELLLRLIAGSTVPLLDALPRDSLIKAAGAPWTLEDQALGVTICRRLVEAGFDVNHTSSTRIDRNDTTAGSALIAASYSGNLEICRLLLENSADISRVSWAGQHGTALIAGATGRHGRAAELDIIRLLLENGAPVNTVGQYDYSSRVTALMAVVTHGGAYFENETLEICRLLCLYGADVNIGATDFKLTRSRDPWKYVTPLTNAVSNPRDDSLDIVALLLENGADPRVKAVGGFGSHIRMETPLEALEEETRHRASQRDARLKNEYFNAKEETRIDALISEKVRLIKARLSELEHEGQS